MTEKNSTKPNQEGDDNAAYDFEYDHGRMPFFMKIAWIGFLVLMTGYIVNHLLVALAEELG